MTILNTVKIIDVDAFINCELIIVHIPNSVVAIREEAFAVDRLIEVTFEKYQVITSKYLFLQAV